LKEEETEEEKEEEKEEEIVTIAVYQQAQVGWQNRDNAARVRCASWHAR
jgi:hypothetical protein